MGRSEVVLFLVVLLGLFLGIKKVWLWQSVKVSHLAEA